MLRKAPLVVILFLILMMGLSSCNTLPTCDPNDLPYLNILSPDWGEVFSIGTDSLSWEFPYTTCDPEGYIIKLSDEPEFVDTSLNATLSTPVTTHNPGSALQPATKYYWQVSAYVGGSIGPAMSYYFYTEPVCNAGVMIAPELISPVDSSVVITLQPEFDWTYPDPDCFPNGVVLRVSEDPDLSTYAIQTTDTDHYFDDMVFGVPLDDCKTYFYQVTPYVNGTMGPASEINKFVINTTGNCACDPIALPVPVPLLPSPYSAGEAVIVPVDMAVTWENPGPCIPDGYEVELDSDFDYSDSTYNGQVSGGGIKSYTPPTLQPATQYWWHSYSTYQGAQSSTSQEATFFTEPGCASQSQLTAPVILSPNNGAFVDTVNPIFNYIPGTPGCIPDIFRIELSTDPNFQGQPMVLEPGFTTTVVGFSDPLSDCTMYYLKVAAVKDGNIGPYSDIHRFYVNEQGTCFPSPIGKANQNVFCNIGPDWEIGIHLFEKDDWIQALARNSDTSYVEVYVPDETGIKPADPQITCWISVNAFFPDATIDLREMVVKYPPLPPEEPKPSGGGPVCLESLPQGQCEAAGGFYYISYPSGKCICK